MIDLHIHTEASDGTDNCISILKKAQNRNLKYLSITDHDNCHMYNNLKLVNISDFYTGTIIPGVELKTLMNGVPIELLGYGVNPDIINEGVKQLYAGESTKDYLKMERLYEKCREIGVILRENVLEEYEAHAPLYKYATSYLHEEITRHISNKQYIWDEASWKDATTFFRRHMSNPESIFYIENRDLIPSCDAVYHLIRKAGGLVFVPHIFIYGKQSMPILKQLVENYDIDGLECFYSHFSEEHTKYLLDFCKRHHLYVSGGSDYHGMNKPGIELGVGKGNLRISSHFIEDWVEQVVTLQEDDAETEEIKIG